MLQLASTTHIVLAEALEWTYSVDKISIPYFMTAGTGNSDAGDGKDNAGIAPLSSLMENYNAISSEAPKIMARRRNTEHGEMHANADSYMTAWFCWLLKGDNDAAKVFTGTSPEIESNTNWQDVISTF